MNDKARRALCAAIAFILPAALISIVFAVMGIWPFGGKSILIYDLRSQYADFFAALRDIPSKGGLFYSLSRAFGGDFLTLAAYYLLSPFNLLFFILPRGAVIEAATAVYYLKIMCISAAFYIFITKTAVISRSEREIAPEAAVLFSLCYAFSGYAVMYAQNLMWLDALYMLPLTMLAAEKAVIRGKNSALTAAIAAAFVINFYTALPITLFTAVYALFLLVKSDKPLPLASIFCTASALITGLLLSMPIVFPAFCKLAETKLSDSNILLRFFPREKLPTILLCGMIIAVLADFALIFAEKRLTGKADNNTAKALYISDRAVLICVLVIAAVYALCAAMSIGGFIECLKKLLPFSYDRDTPVMYMSSLCVLFAVLPAARAIRLKKPREAAFTALIMLAALPTVCRPLDVILHMGQNPISFPARYSYIFTFTVIFAAAYAFAGIKSGTLNLRVMQISAMCVAALTVAELGLTAVGGYKYNENVYYGYYEKSSYDSYIDITQSALDKAEGGRTEKTFYRYLNDSLALGYNGLSHYSSMYNRPLISLMKTLGYAASEYWSSYFGSTPVLDSLFDVRNVMSLTADEFAVRAYIKRAGGEYAEYLYSKAASDSFIDVYENGGALGLGYVVAESFDALTLGGLNPFEAQNALVSAMLGEETLLFTPLDFGEPIPFGMEATDSGYIKGGEDSNLSYCFDAERDGTVYMYLDSSDPLPCEIKVNGKTISNYRSSQSGISYTLCLGDFKDGAKINVALMPKDERLTIRNMYIYTLRSDFADIISSIPRGQTEAVESATEFTFTTDSSGTLFTSLPIESGWTVKVDGEKASYYAGAGAFICVKLGDGNHIVSMTYTPPGLYSGFMLFTAGIILLILSKYGIIKAVGKRSLART